VIGFRDYIAYAEKHLAIAEAEIENGKSGAPYLIPSVILAWSAIESFVNNRLDDFDSLPPRLFAPHERAFLTEQTLTFINSGKKAGQFIITGTYYRKLTDKILFLVSKCGSRIEKGNKLWTDFDNLKKVRDSLIHPRKAKQQRVIDPKVARDCIATSKRLISVISKGLGQKIEF
jgi:hypothetical protein